MSRASESIDEWSMWGDQPDQDDDQVPSSSSTPVAVSAPTSPVITETLNARFWLFKASPSAGSAAAQVESPDLPAVAPVGEGGAAALDADEHQVNILALKKLVQLFC